VVRRKLLIGLLIGVSIIFLLTNVRGIATKLDAVNKEEVKSEAMKGKSNRPFNTPSWISTSNIYELNVRQFTKEGTFAAMRKHLPRLADMGVDIIWFMPIYPISTTKRKGSMGSYYASSDFNAVNPEFGTLEEFNTIVDEIHGLGMHVILDWTANHTGWDHPWLKDHPDFYVRREGTDTIRHAFNPNDGGETDWYDIAQLDYSNPDLTPAMIEQMRFWRKQSNIDGFRCDVAGFVPLDFWYAARPELEKDGPLVMLAEWGDEPLHFEAAFDINYGWDFHQLLNKIAEGEAGVADIWAYQEIEKLKYPDNAIHLNFTTNHDENSWNGTEFERLGHLADAFWVVCATFDGMPLVYSGQEEPLHRRLAFFEKDDIGFSAYAKTNFFKKLLSLRRTHPALQSGVRAASATKLKTSVASSKLLAYVRSVRESHVLVLVNMGDERISIPVTDFDPFPSLKNLYTSENVDLASDERVEVAAKGFVVLTTYE